MKTRNPQIQEAQETPGKIKKTMLRHMINY